jgi:hypothetical protein
MFDGRYHDIPIADINERCESLRLVVDLLQQASYTLKSVSGRHPPPGCFTIQEFITSDGVDSLGEEVTFTTSHHQVFNFWEHPDKPEWLIVAPGGKANNNRLFINLARPDGDFSLSWLNEIIRGDRVY